MPPGFELRITGFCFQRLYHNSLAIVAFKALKQGLQHQRYDAKSINTNLTFLVYLEF